MSAPALVIIFELERTPRVVCDALNDSEALRLRDWLRADERRRELLETLFELLEAAA